mgnify:FL=1
MNGVIKMNDAGTIKSFKVDFVRDIFFGAIFMGKLWKDIEPDVLAEDKEEAKKIYEESRKEWHGLTSKVSLKI